MVEEVKSRERNLEKKPAKRPNTADTDGSNPLARGV
jgi:hypothetical protein